MNVRWKSAVHHMKPARTVIMNDMMIEAAGVSLTRVQILRTQDISVWYKMRNGVTA